MGWDCVRLCRSVVVALRVACARSFIFRRGIYLCERFFVCVVAVVVCVLIPSTAGPRARCNCFVVNGGINAMGRWRCCLAVLCAWICVCVCVFCVDNIKYHLMWAIAQGKVLQLCLGAIVLLCVCVSTVRVYYVKMENEIQAEIDNLCILRWSGSFTRQWFDAAQCYAYEFMLLHAKAAPVDDGHTVYASTTFSWKPKSL